MKNLLLVCFTALLAVAVTGCSDPETVVVRGLQLSANGVVFDAGGGEEVVTIAPFPDDEQWQVECAQPQVWFDYQVDGNLLTISVESNPASTYRTASVEVVSPSGAFKPYLISITQESAVEESYFSSSADEEYLFDSQGGAYSFNVISSVVWSVSSSEDWLTVEQNIEQGKVTMVALGNEGDAERSAEVTLSWGEGGEDERLMISVVQQTRADNLYLKLLGKWIITASKWFYSPNGSLNSLDYVPSAADYYLIFDMEQGVYGETLIMKDFLYPGTMLEVRYDKATGGIVIPFGWSVYAYEVFLYITCVGTSSFSYASAEVEAIPSDDFVSLVLDMPSVSGFNYVGFGLWTYSDNGGKQAFGSRSYPTMFPMGDIVFQKYDTKN